MNTQISLPGLPPVQSEFPPPIGTVVTLLPVAVESLAWIGSSLQVKVRDELIPELGITFSVMRDQVAWEVGQVIGHGKLPDPMDPMGGERLVIRIEWRDGGYSVVDKEEFYRRRKWYRFS